jgi:K+-transporting ATPase ATPase B chain
MTTTQTPVHTPAPRVTELSGHAYKRRKAFDRRLILAAVPVSFAKLDPRQMRHSPVMFTVLLGTAVSAIACIVQIVQASPDVVFSVVITVWLLLTVLFANFSEALAEGRGKAQADSLRAGRQGLVARRLRPSPAAASPATAPVAIRSAEESVPAPELRKGDLVVCEAGDVIPSDGEIVEGLAMVDESAITGESAPVIRESGGDRSAVTGGTKVISDRIVVRITAEPGQTFIDRMIALVEGAERQKTPNEIALHVLLVALTIIFLVVTVALVPFAALAGAVPSPVVLVALLVCLIPTTIGALVPAIGIAGMDRLVRHNVLATSGRAVETAGDITTLLLDKTGTITFGNRRAVDFLPAPGVPEAEFIEAARLSSLADETPEGRSIVDLAGERGAAGPGLDELHRSRGGGVTAVEFTAMTRMSGLDDGSRRYRKGAASAVAHWVRELGGDLPPGVRDDVDSIAGGGGTPLVVATDDGGRPRVLGTVHLADVVKPGIADRFAALRRMGIRTVMITGDNRLTAAAIAKEAGVDDYLAEATPEDKLTRIRAEQKAGQLVAMTGDGTNDAPALAAADVGVAMNSGTQAAKEAANMVDLDSDPTKLIDVVAIGKQLLITRGSLTTFSVANDVAKYFAIIPALFVAAFPGLGVLNIMGLASPKSAILAAVVFNAIIIVLLVPLALRGVRYRAVSAQQALRRNLLIYGVGGIIAPFIGIKIIDLLLAVVPGLH